MISSTGEKRTGCNPLLKVLILLFLLAIIYHLSTQEPVNYPKLIGGIAFSLIILLNFTPWFQSLYRQHSSLTLSITLIILEGIAILTSVSGHSVNYPALFVSLFSVCLFLLVVSPWNKPLLLHFPAAYLILYALIGGVACLLLLVFDPGDNTRLIITAIISVLGWLFIYAIYRRRPCQTNRRFH